MTDEELKLKCLELSLECMKHYQGVFKVPDIIETASIYFDFIIGKSKSDI
jgi:hypothetical protein